MIARPPRRITSPTEATRRLRERIVHIFQTSWPDPIPAPVLIARLDEPPSSVRRLLDDLKAAGIIEPLDRARRDGLIALLEPTLVALEASIVAELSRPPAPPTPPEGHP